MAQNLISEKMNSENDTLTFTTKIKKKQKKKNGTSII